MTTESKRLWKRICRELLNKHPRHIKLLLDWRDAECRELVQACRSALASINEEIAANSDDDHPVIESHRQVAKRIESAIDKATGRRAA